MNASLTATHTQAATFAYKADLLDVSDIPAALALIEKVRASSAIEHPYHLKPKDADYLSSLHKDGLPLLGIKSATGALIGFTAIYPLADSGIVMMESVCTDPDIKRQRLATTLIKAAEDWAREQGHTRLTAKVAMNNAASLNLFTSQGFEPSHHGVGHDMFTDEQGQQHAYTFCLMEKAVASWQRTLTVNKSNKNNGFECVSYNHSN